MARSSLLAHTWLLLACSMLQPSPLTQEHQLVSNNTQNNAQNCGGSWVPEEGRTQRGLCTPQLIFAEENPPPPSEIGSPLLHDVVKLVAGLVVLQPLYCAPLALPVRLPQLADKDLQAEGELSAGGPKHRVPPQALGRGTHLVLPELVDDGLMEEEPDVLEEIEGPGGRGAFVHLLLVLGLVGVDPLQDAEAPAGGESAALRPGLSLAWSKASTRSPAART